MFEEIRKAAIAAVLNIFETMFFTFLEPADGNRPLEEALKEQEKESDLLLELHSPWFIKSEIHFTGLQAGFLRLFIPYDLSETLTMNFMGFEQEVTESQIVDMAGELTNMICGNLFSSLDKSSVYVLSSPSTQKIFLQERLERIDSSDINLNFLTEGQQITLNIQFEQLQ